MNTLLCNIFLKIDKIDIYDLNFAFDERMAFLSVSSHALPKPGVLIRIVAFFWHLIEGLFHLSLPFVTSCIPKRSILFLVYTKNQKDALIPIAKKTQNSYFVGYKVPVDGRFPMFWAYIMAIPFFPLVLFKLWTAKGYRRRTFRYNFDQYWLTYGFYFIAQLWLKQLAPSVLIVSNDHNMPNRVVIKIAREMRIPTIYVQHASITDRFPSLFFDYALLEGQDALRKYDQAGESQTLVFLVGMPKMDPYIKLTNHRSQVQSVGICTNLLDPLLRVDELCAYIRSNFPNLSLVIRPHPRDKRHTEWAAFAQKHNASFSDSRVELSFEFLSNLDVIFVGDSNILLEAALMNIYPIYYDFLQQAQDYYGFVRNGLTEYVSEPQEAGDKLRLLLALKPDVRIRTKMYCATVGTLFDGRSSELASNLIEQISQSGDVNIANWQIIPNIGLVAYETRVN